MGLDMYLTKSHFIWNHAPKGQKSMREKLVVSGIDGIKTERISHIIEQIAYWSKCHTIHQWFVENVQEGSDDCKEYFVSAEQLQELVDFCREELKTATSSMDVYEREELTTTIEQIVGVLDEEGDLKTFAEYYYQASW